MATQAALAASLVELKTQAEKSKAEILAKIDELQNTVGETTPEVDAAFEALKASVQGIDDIVPDAPPPSP